jgi:sec-independent protein translocase protein TatC
MSETEAVPTTLYDHIRELQFRLLSSVVVLLIGGILGYLFYNPIFQLLRSPLHSPLYYSTPAGSFIFVMKICLLVAIAFALPVIIYNLIMFIRPAFTEQLSKKRVYLTTIGSVVLSACGALFAFIIILPASIRFFVGFQVTGLHALLDASTYLMFVVNILISFMLVFQLPLLISFIDHIKPISPRKLLKYEKYVIIGGLIIGVIAPFSFDPTTELLIAAPIIVLFNLSILMIALQHAYKRSIIQREGRRNTVIVDQPLELLPQISLEEASVLARSFSRSTREIVYADSLDEEPIVVIRPSTNVSKYHWMDVAPSSQTDLITQTTRPVRVIPAAAYRKSRSISDFL